MFILNITLLKVFWLKYSWLLYFLIRLFCGCFFVAAKIYVLAFRGKKKKSWSPSSLSAVFVLQTLALAPGPKQRKAHREDWDQAVRPGIQQPSYPYSTVLHTWRLPVVIIMFSLKVCLLHSMISFIRTSALFVFLVLAPTYSVPNPSAWHIRSVQLILVKWMSTVIRMLPGI